MRTASLRHSPAFVRWAGAEGVSALGSAVSAVVLPILVSQRAAIGGLVAEAMSVRAALATAAVTLPATAGATAIALWDSGVDAGDREVR
jgi:hypothetical protein